MDAIAIIMPETKVFEGLRLHSYKDSAGVWTIGYGHTGDNVHQNQVITEAEAEKLLEQDLRQAQSIVTQKVSVPLNVNEEAALIDLVFNLGPVVLGIKSTLRKKLIFDDRKGAAKEILRWCNATDPATGKKAPLPGLVNRRRKNYELFLTEVPHE